MIHIPLPLIPAQYQTGVWIFVIASAVLGFLAKTMLVLAAQVKPCPACQKYVSVKAKHCPQCGASIEP
ncbi:MAG: hypothetical protein ACM3YO_00390 [Bacteroidota bacterium]